MDKFKFIGKLRATTKDAFTTRAYESGWEISRYNFLCLSGDNSQFLTVSAGKWSATSGKDTVIYTLAKSEKGQKCEKLNVSWKDRKKPEIIEQVAAFKKFVIDLNAEDQDDESAASKNRREYIHKYDFIMDLKDILDDERFKDALFEITGSIEYSYNAEKNEYFSSFAPVKVRRVADNAAPSCTGTVELYFSDETPEGPAFDTSIYAETGLIKVHGYSKFYDEMAKKNGYSPVIVQIPCAKDQVKKFDLFKKMFSLSNRNEVKRIALDVEFLKGSQKVEITYDDLSDFQKELIDCGLQSLEGIKKQMAGGGKAYGDKTTSNIFKGLGYGYSNGPVIDEAVTPEDLNTPPIPEERPAKTTAKKTTDDDDSLFGL